MNRFFALSLVTLAACGKPPVEAPAELNDLTLFITTHFADEDTAELDAGLVNLNAFMDGVTYMDGDEPSDIDDRAYTVAPLTQDALGGMPTHDGFSPEEQIPVAITALSVHDMDGQLETVAEPNQVCIESATTKYYSRTFDTDLDAFLNRSAEWLETSNEVRKESPLGDVWYDLKKEYRWREMEDGTEVLIARTWAPDVYPTDGGGGTFDQTYILDVWYPDGDQTRRYISMWSSVTLSLINDNAWAGLVRGGLDEHTAFADDYINDFADELCREDRDRAYDRP